MSGLLTLIIITRFTIVECIELESFAGELFVVDNGVIKTE